MGKDRRIKLERRAKKAAFRRMDAQIRADILVELSVLSEEYNRRFIDHFGSLDQEGDFQNAIDQKMWIRERIDFWFGIRDKYDDCDLDNLSDVQDNDFRILSAMIADLHKILDSVS